jgi:hypothetical protein
MTHPLVEQVRFARDSWPQVPSRRGTYIRVVGSTRFYSCGIPRASGGAFRPIPDAASERSGACITGA